MCYRLKHEGLLYSNRRHTKAGKLCLPDRVGQRFQMSYCELRGKIIDIV
jgi:hypothetical protein